MIKTTSVYCIQLLYRIILFSLFSNWNFITYSGHLLNMFRKYTSNFQYPNCITKVLRWTYRVISYLMIFFADFCIWFVDPEGQRSLFLCLTVISHWTKGNALDFLFDHNDAWRQPCILLFCCDELFISFILWLKSRKREKVMKFWRCGTNHRNDQINISNLGPQEGKELLKGNLSVGSGKLQYYFSK